MMLNCASLRLMLMPSSLGVQTRRSSAMKPPRLSVARSASTDDNHRGSALRCGTDDLRTQLDQLHAEYETTRSKANNARSRLMRLSEAAENLQKRAGRSVLAGKDTEARELLIQKKRILQALEKTKNRINLLDELSLKINEAISVKETQLIGDVAVYPEFNGEETVHRIHFVKPNFDGVEVSSEASRAHEDFVNRSQDDTQGTGEIEASSLMNRMDLSSTEASETSRHKNFGRGLKGISSYNDFLQYVDQQLQQVESDLLMILSLSNLILEDEQKEESTKMQHTSEILNDIRSIRERIASISKEGTDKSQTRRRDT